LPQDIHPSILHPLRPNQKPAIFDRMGREVISWF
jgi:hypothetical protein